MRLRTKHLVFAVVATALGSAPVLAQSTDVTQWRGSNRDGVVTSFTAPVNWPDMLTQRWKVDVGTGYATPLVVGTRVYVFSRVGDNETMTALDVASGKQLWQTGYPAPFAMNPATKAHGPGPKSTPVFANGRIFSIGMSGIVTAFDAASGKQLWQKPGSGVPMEYTTHAFSPMVDGSRVIFHVGGKDKGALTAFDQATGEARWSWAGDGPGYASPIVATLGGTRQIITPTQAKMVGVDAATGALLWERPMVHQFASNSITPIVHGETVIVAGTGPLMAFAVKRGAQWTTEQIWENAELPLRFATPVLRGDTLFGLSGRNAGQYYAIDARTGKTLWTSEGRQAAHASVARVGDVWVTLESDGELVVLRPSQTTFDPVKRYKVADTETWAQPALSGNRILVKDVTSLTMWSLN
jgi:outer membrane protein assembly factor BamB